MGWIANLKSLSWQVITPTDDDIEEIINKGKMGIFKYNKWLTLNETDMSYNRYSLNVSNNKRERIGNVLTKIPKSL